ncbi:UNVERIFIED_CONTAM: hypothetical protein K2H54_000676 [Gekko kuhli]
MVSDRVFPMGLPRIYKHSSANYKHSGANYSSAIYKHSGANYSSAIYKHSGANYSSANYKHSGANYSSAIYKHSGANYSSAIYKHSGANYSSAIYKHSGANYSSANYKHSGANYSSAIYKHSSAIYKHSSVTDNRKKHHNFTTCSDSQCYKSSKRTNHTMFKWICSGYCTGWGDPHYKTFDGLYYSYQGNCTYTLVEEINKNIDNFGVYIDNYHCDPREPVSCPCTLFVRHETQEVRITTVREVPMKVQVLVNGQTVALPYKKYGLKVYESGVNQVVEIPELKMNVTYNGMAFTIRLPYHLFGNNTQGQCGTYTKNKTDDCRLRNGSLASSCEVMADSWIVNDPTKPQCLPLLPPPRPPTAPPCKPSPLCGLLQSSVFKKCHEAVDPRNYYEACLFDSCRIPDRNIECATLQIYAATCADQGVCIDWRKFTNGSCCKYLALLWSWEH